MTQKDAIILAIENAKANNKILDNKTIISILEATKTIAEEGNLINSLIQLYQTMDSEKFKKLKTLTKREQQILTLIGNGLLTHKIADTLRLSITTVETHRKNIRKKLDLNGKGKAKLIEFALLYNFIKPNIHDH